MYCKDDYKFPGSETLVILHIMCVGEIVVCNYWVCPYFIMQKNNLYNSCSSALHQFELCLCDFMRY